MSNGIPRRLADLAEHHVIFNLRGGYPAEWRFPGSRRGAVPRLHCRFAIDDVETTVAAVMAGHGLARLLSYQVFDELKAGKVKRVLREFEPPLVPVQVLSRPAERPHPMVTRLVDRLAAGLRDNPVLE